MSRANSFSSSFYLKGLGVLVDLSVGDLDRAQEVDDEEPQLVLGGPALVVLEDLGKPTRRTMSCRV